MAHLTAAVDHLLGHFGGQGIDGPAEDGDGDDGLAAHGVDIADGVGGGDAAKGEGVIDDGHEEVGGGDNALTVADIDHGRVILAAVANDQGRVVEARDLALEDGVEYLGRDFAAAASAVAVLGQTNGRHTYPFYLQTEQRLCGAVLVNGRPCSEEDKKPQIWVASVPTGAAMTGSYEGPPGRTGKKRATRCASAAPPRATGRGIMPHLPLGVRTGIHINSRELPSVPCHLSGSSAG